jgi:hypothetical protein
MRTPANNPIASAYLAGVRSVTRLAGSRVRSARDTRTERILVLVERIEQGALCGPVLPSTARLARDARQQLAWLLDGSDVHWRDAIASTLATLARGQRLRVQDAIDAVRQRTEVSRAQAGRENTVGPARSWSHGPERYAVLRSTSQLSRKTGARLVDRNPGDALPLGPDSRLVADAGTLHAADWLRGTSYRYARPDSAVALSGDGGIAGSGDPEKRSSRGGKRRGRAKRRKGNAIR